jgi:hypothetical protein
MQLKPAVICAGLAVAALPWLAGHGGWLAVSGAALALDAGAMARLEQPAAFAPRDASCGCPPGRPDEPGRCGAPGPRPRMGNPLPVIAPWMALLPVLRPAGCGSR